MKVPAPEKIIKYISKINHIYPEKITLHRQAKEDCPSCSYNPVHGGSSNPFCPTCGGKGYIITDNPLTIDCSVDNLDEAQINLIAPGEVLTDLLSITIDSQEITEHNIDVTEIDYFTYRGSDYVLKAYTEETLQGVLYEINCILKRKVGA
jgi:hypothetical protein